MVFSDLDSPLGYGFRRAVGRQVSDVERELREAEVDVAVCYLPTGARRDVQAYALAACQAGGAFVNGCPEPVVHDEQIRTMFERARIPLLGDDMKSHAGATALHTLLVDFLRRRNIDIDNTYQLNVGGNADFRNLADHARAISKHRSKRAALEGAGIASGSEVLARPAGLVPYLQDRKIAYIHVDDTSILGMKLDIELRLDVEDSPNTVSVIADAIHIAMLTKATPEAAQLACAHLF
jgi:myo-inositol-1-phosphate synthase